ncbi:sigma-70 family RNA polymerase sigma factor [Asticcacaulis sp.]|uniref:sigma-70 family RNA polymerase sigma factor n=1 Tax=Asticcacaulis sp. TaxID=1872648 RepID=UPI00262D06A6|nr:sigma-70 family RNA polymerase sigma factor [Asticcacaulis sp.]
MQQAPAKGHRDRALPVFQLPDLQDRGGFLRRGRTANWSLGGFKMTIELNAVDTHVGERIRARRLFLQMSEEWLAGFLEMPVADLVAIEEGKKRIGSDELMRCTEALGVPERYFYMGFGSKPPGPDNSKPWSREIDRWFATNLFPHEGFFMNIAIRLTRNRETAREMLQDAYLYLVRDDNWRKVEFPRAYVKQVLHFRFWSKLQRDRIVPIDLVANFEAIDQVSDEPTAFDLLSAGQRRHIVLQAIEDLPPRCRQVVKLRRLKEMSPPDIAKEMGISVSMVEKHLAKGMNLIGKRLGEPYNEEPSAPSKPPIFPNKSRASE